MDEDGNVGPATGIQSDGKPFMRDFDQRAVKREAAAPGLMARTLTSTKFMVLSKHIFGASHAVINFASSSIGVDILMGMVLTSKSLKLENDKFRKEDMKISVKEAFIQRSNALQRAERKAQEEQERLRQREHEQIAEQRRRDLVIFNFCPKVSICTILLRQIRLRHNLQFIICLYNHWKKMQPYLISKENM
uniref:Uncharacterized protein n=1 Tax=Salix viminalis TaxID=40686 RepID=A0A6N2KDN6_SALVM